MLAGQLACSFVPSFLAEHAAPATSDRLPPRLRRSRRSGAGAIRLRRLEHHQRERARNPADHDHHANHPGSVHAGCAGGTRDVHGDVTRTVIAMHQGHWLLIAAEEVAADYVHQGEL